MGIQFMRIQCMGIQFMYFNKHSLKSLTKVVEMENTFEFVPKTTL